jgi:hypothetical protein
MDEFPLIPQHAVASNFLDFGTPLEPQIGGEERRLSECLASELLIVRCPNDTRFQLIKNGLNYGTISSRDLGFASPAEV